MSKENPMYMLYNGIMKLIYQLKAMSDSRRYLSLTAIVRRADNLGTVDRLENGVIDRIRYKTDFSTLSTLFR
ncbi:hypothetical protein SATMO3_63050 (plasmid) [Sporomusa aerivorans]